MWKDFFYYSKSERRAVFFLLTLIVLLLATIIIYSKRDMTSSELEAGNTEEVDSFLADIHRLKKQPVKSGKDYYGKDAPKIRALFEFNPNSADSIELSRLGLPPFVIKNVLKYRAKGGRFKTPASFARIYGLSPELFAELEPYIRIPERTSVNREPSVPRASDTLRKKVRKLPAEKYAEGTKVDANVADTVELKKIPGIGSVIAGNIVAYRERLGGFHALEQLCEVRFFTPELLEWFVLGDSPLRKLRVNQESLERLRAHPYLNFHQAKVIVEHRRKKGKIKSLSQLSLYEEFTGKDLERLSAYISFD